MSHDAAMGVALVIGGSGGIGAAVCRVLADAGWRIALTYRGGKERADEVARDIDGALAFRLDLGDTAGPAEVVRDVTEAMGAPSAVVNAAGVDFKPSYISETPPEDLASALTEEAAGFLRVIQAALPGLREVRGAVVAVTSAGTLRYPPRDILSVAPKGAIEGIVRGIAREEGKFGVRANCVALGVIEAGMFERAMGEKLGGNWVAVAKMMTPLGRFGSAEEVAEVVAFLAGQRSSYVTGQVIAVDGGFSV